MAFLDQITPNFLKHIDRYLLLNAPLVWRTRIHYLLFSFVVGNAVIAAIIFALPISKQRLPSMDAISNWVWIAITFLAFAALYWAYTQFKYKLETSAFSGKLLTYSLYLAGVLILASHYVVLHGTLIYRIASVEEPADFEEENAYLIEKHSLHLLDKRPVILDERSEEIFASYGITSNGWDSKLYEYEEAKNIIREAHYFFEAKFDNDFYSWYHKEFLILACLGLLGIPCLLLIISYAKVSEIFIVGFAHVFGFLGFIAFSSVVPYTSYAQNFKIQSYYIGLSFILGLLALFQLKNTRLAKINYFALLLVIPFTSWVFLMQQTNGLSYAKITEATIFLQAGFPCILFSLFFFHLMSKRLSQPKA